jgi:hypothetical protein
MDFTRVRTRNGSLAGAGWSGALFGTRQPYAYVKVSLLTALLLKLKNLQAIACYNGLL